MEVDWILDLIDALLEQRGAGEGRDQVSALARISVGVTGHIAVEDTELFPLLLRSNPRLARVLPHWGFRLSPDPSCARAARACKRCVTRARATRAFGTSSLVSRCRAQVEDRGGAEVLGGTADRAPLRGPRDDSLGTSSGDPLSAALAGFLRIAASPHTLNSKRRRLARGTSPVKLAVVSGL